MARYTKRVTPSTSPLEFDVVMVDTKKATCLLIDGEEYWIPKSLIHGKDPAVGETNGTIDVEEWFLRKEGLI